MAWDEMVNRLLLELQELLPELQNIERVSIPMVLEEACNHIRRLKQELDGLGRRIDHVLDNVDSEQATTIVRLLDDC